MSDDKTMVSRRGFIGALGAFAAALTAGKAMPAGVEVATGRGSVKPLKEQIDLLEILKDCRVVSYEKTTTLTGPSTLEVKYRHAPGSARTSLDDVVDAARKHMLPVSATVDIEYTGIDVSILGICRAVSDDDCVRTVEVVFR